MKKFYGNEERRIGKLKPVSEHPPELRRKQEKEERHSDKQKNKKYLQ